MVELDIMVSSCLSKVVYRSIHIQNHSKHQNWHMPLPPRCRLSKWLKMSDSLALLGKPKTPTA